MPPPSPSTPSEGEIVESDTEKATTSLRSLNGTSVDRRSRNRVSVSRSPSPYQSPRRYRSRTPSRSPYREAVGGKRSREDDHYGDRVRNTSRRSKPRHGDRAHAAGRHLHFYHDELGGSRELSASTRYDGRETQVRIRDKSSRTWNSSPVRSKPSAPEQSRFRQSGTNGQLNRFRREVLGGKGREEGTGRLATEQSVSDRSYTPVAAAPRKRDTEHLSNQTQPPFSISQNLTQNAAEAEMAFTSDQSETTIVGLDQPIDEAALIEERRKRREAIKAKYKLQKSPSSVAISAIANHGHPITAISISDPPQSHIFAHNSPVSKGKLAIDLESSTSLSVIKGAEITDATPFAVEASQEDEPSAADYDPTMDMQEDQIRHDNRHREGELALRAYAETKLIGDDDHALKRSTSSRDQVAFDMFAEVDELDMFAEAPFTLNEGSKPQSSRGLSVPQAKALDMSMLDDWDDHEGYYKVILGELLDSRYHVQSNLGKGMFSGVVRATDQRTMKLVAIKLIRNNETMKKAGIREIEILQKLVQHDPEDKKHMIRLERFFEHKGHLCMVFENLSINLREVLKKFGRDVGINLKAVRTYAQQMFLGLSLLRKCNIIHADLKPDNVLVNESRNLLKICDLGSASDASENEITPYLVSRFYRAPEIILGLPYDFGIDIWSIGCTLFELYTGKILFTGRSNNQMLLAIMECRGKFSHKMLRKSQFASLHFDDLLNFRSVEKDRLSGKDVVRVLNFTKPTRDLKTRLMANVKGMDENELKELSQFVDLLDKCLNLNPEKRCTPTEALKHQFITRAKFS